MAYENIEYQVDGAVARIRLNRPDQLNELNAALMGELKPAVDMAAGDDSIRALVLCAAGRAFCSGADLKEGFSQQRDTGDVLRSRYHPIIETLYTLEKPVIAQVQGIAAGAGASLALAADLVVAGQSARFAQVFTNIGLVPDAGSTWILPRLIGQARAKAAVLTGEAIEAETAERWGMIWRVVGDDVLEDEVTDVARTMAERPTRALGLAKCLLNESWDHTLHVQLECEAQTQVQAQNTEDFTEAVQAFIDKRDARFSGR